MKVVFFGILALLACARAGNAQSQEEWEFPLSKLPEHVDYAKGKFSIYADFDHGKNGAVTIIMVNDTDKEIRLPSQDGDVYLKQEAKVDGKWLRAQPHRYSWCGNSYMSSPTISPKHFAKQSTEFNGWVSRVKPVKVETQVMPVRYRFYTDTHFDVISNQGEMPVSLELIKLSEFDTMALNFGTVEKLASVATGEVKVDSLDHMKSKWTAVSRLSKFPGNPIAQSAIRKVVKDLYHLKKDDERRSHYQARGALSVVAQVFDADEAQEIYLELIKDPAFSYRENALTSLVYGIKGKVTETNNLLDGFLESYDDPLFSTALHLRTLSWPDDDKRKELKKVYQDNEAPKEIRTYAKGLYYGSFPNPYINVWMRYSDETALINVSIENISTKSIELEYSHFYDLFNSEIELGYGKDQVPYRKDFKELVDSERGELLKKVLKAREKIVFSEVNIWRYHQIPEPLPKNFIYRVISNQPQFGDVPAGRMGMHFESENNLKRKILMNAKAEQK